MARDSRNPVLMASDAFVGQKKSEILENGHDPLNHSSFPEPDYELALARLRERWELASVFNFFNVFEPVIGNGLMISAEEIEKGLIQPDGSLAKLHITLLKGIPPVSKSLDGSDAWVTILCKKLHMWWPWVAEGDIPLSAANGEEIFRYKELDPTTRLLILKALCEIRADQDDAVSYVNDALKGGTDISSFRKDRIGGDGNEILYWYDGNLTVGHRLYKEVKKCGTKLKVKGRECLSQPPFSSHWETLATNLDEFREVVGKFSSSNEAAAVAVGKAIEADVISVLEKIQKRKERSLKRKQRQEMLMNNFENFSMAGTTRSCRQRKHVTYTFDEYDRAIDEALHPEKEWKTKEKQGHEHKNAEHGKRNSNSSDTGSDFQTRSRDHSVNTSDSVQTNADDNNQQNGGDDADYDGSTDGKSDDTGYSNQSDKEKGSPGRRKQKTNVSERPAGSRRSKRLAGIDSSSSVSETRSVGMENRLRQRPNRSDAIESVVPDSEDESSRDDR